MSVTSHYFYVVYQHLHAQLCGNPITRTHTDMWQPTVKLYKTVQTLHKHVQPH